MILSEKLKIVQQFNDKITQLSDEDFFTLIEIVYLFWKRKTLVNSKLKDESEIDKLIWKNIIGISVQDDGTSSDKLKKPLFGCMKGGITYMSADFDEQLEDFKDYMN
jgi:hypothetical protein